MQPIIIVNKIFMNFHKYLDLLSDTKKTGLCCHICYKKLGWLLELSSINNNFASNPEFSYHFLQELLGMVFPFFFMLLSRPPYWIVSDLSSQKV